MSHTRNGAYQTPKDEWETPQWLFDLLNEEFKFRMDAAATRENSKCHSWYFDKIGDALGEDWIYHCHGHPVLFLNPPYSAGNIDKFMAKAYVESQKGAVVVCLVPCATDTKWWHNYAMKAQEIRFIKGRVRFIGYDEQGNQIKNSPTFSSCVVVFDIHRHTLGGPRPDIGETIEQPRKVPA